MCLWASVSEGPFSIDLAAVLEAFPGLCLLALTHPYAIMLSAALAGLPTASVGRLRLFGWRLEGLLAPQLHDCVMPYDRRLDTVLPGTQNDFAHRALVHFQDVVHLSEGHEPRAHADAIRLSLVNIAAPRRPVRPRASDDDIARWINSNEGIGIRESLRRIRIQGIACEQARFSRLYRQSRTKVVA